MTSSFGVEPTVIAAWMAIAVGAILLGLLVLGLSNQVLLRMALRNLPRRPIQTALILFGLSLATLIFTASTASGDTVLYSLQASQMRQAGGIDEAFTRSAGWGYPSTRETDFFTEAEERDLVARSLADPDIASAAGVIVAPGALVDTTTSQMAAQNIRVFGVPNDFHSIWGTLHSRAGADLDAAQLGSDEVYIGNLVADRLGARAGDGIQLYVDGLRADVRVRDVMDTEINPASAWSFLDAGSVVIGIDAVRRVMNRPTGYNLILLHNHGNGGVDDLGPQGSRGAEISRRMRAVFIDREAAAELKAYLKRPAIRAQLRQMRDGFPPYLAARDLPSSDATPKALLDALDRPDTGDDFQRMAGDVVAQQIMHDATHSAGSALQDLDDLLASLHVDSAAAREMKTLLDDPEIRFAMARIAAALPASDSTSTTIGTLLAEVERPGMSPRFKAMISDADLRRALGAGIGVMVPAHLARFNEIADRIDLFDLREYKAQAVLSAQIFGLFAVGGLVAASFFSMTVGVLLIFLIFVMLAAERRAELGMSRAVGLKRRHLIQMFLFEGTAYTVAASIVGVAAGVLVGRLMSGAISTPVTGFYRGGTLEYHIEWTSLVISFCLGILLTFVAVVFSAYRVSRLNIVSAIRDLDESESRDAGLVRMFTHVYGTEWFGVRQLWHRNPLVYLGRLTWGTLRGIRIFWWALFRRGPLTVGLGVLLVAYAVGQVPVVTGDSIIDASGALRLDVEIAYAAGVSLVLIGAGLLIRWIAAVGGVRNQVAARIGFTVAALGLLLYWGRPFGHVEKLLHIEGMLQVSKPVTGVGVFGISALMVVLGAVWLVMYNSDLLIRGVMFFTGRVGTLSPVTRTSMAYPLATKFRTGMAVAMFALVTFAIVYMSVAKNVVSQTFAQADTGGWQIVAFKQGDQALALPANIDGDVRADSTVAGEVLAVGWENTDHSPLRVVDDAYLSATRLVLKHRAAGFSSDSEAWRAVRDNPGYAVVGASVDPDKVPPGPTFEPYKMQVAVYSNPPTSAPGTLTVTVVGVIDRTLWDGVYVSTRTATSGGYFASPTAGSTLPLLSPTGYYFMVRPGVDIAKARLDLGRMLLKYDLEPTLSADQAGPAMSFLLPLVNLVTAFLALGLIVGIAGLGVISTRAVVERLQQIGMLRALGYRRSLVQRSFLMEASLIAVLGLLIGSVSGVWLSYRFFVVDKAFGPIRFDVPVAEIAGFLILAYLTTLLATYLPSRAASRIAPAAALRYE